jgi:plasmid stabilization system protein ParE
MRRLIFAPSFDQELEDIGVHAEELFGEAVRHELIAEPLLATFPDMATDRHGYQTSLVGFVFRSNWIFFEHDAAEVRFLHIVDSKRDRRLISF